MRGHNDYELAPVVGPPPVMVGRLHLKQVAAGLNVVESQRVPAAAVVPSSTVDSVPVADVRIVGIVQCSIADREVALVGINDDGVLHRDGQTGGLPVHVQFGKHHRRLVSPRLQTVVAGNIGALFLSEEPCTAREPHRPLFGEMAGGVPEILGVRYRLVALRVPLHHPVGTDHEQTVVVPDDGQRHTGVGGQRRIALAMVGKAWTVGKERLTGGSLYAIVLGGHVDVALCVAGNIHGGIAGQTVIVATVADQTAEAGLAHVLADDARHQPVA